MALKAQHGGTSQCQGLKQEDLKFETSLCYIGSLMPSWATYIVGQSQKRKEKNVYTSFFFFFFEVVLEFELRASHFQSKYPIA
jgi:hypothetical protein